MKNSEALRLLLDTWFTDTTLGMPGDEDGDVHCPLKKRLAKL